jgi:hypothetical protein
LKYRLKSADCHGRDLIRKTRDAIGKVGPSAPVNFIPLQGPVTGSGHLDGMDFREELASLLRSFEHLGVLIDGFHDAFGSDPRSSDMIFAITRAREGADQAAAVLRNHLRTNER